MCHGPLSNAAFPALAPNLSFILLFYPVYLFLWVLVWRFPSSAPRDKNAGFSVLNVILEKALMCSNNLLFNLLLVIVWIRKNITWTRTRWVLSPLRPTRRLLSNQMWSTPRVQDWINTTELVHSIKRSLSLFAEGKLIWGIVRREMMRAAMVRRTVTSR